ncbi:DUF803-domain-containing protein [Clavulina sp. PMI_390]|nr:DUF803-domain-containing protein [Clavulina sp. PMI_390]
MSSLSSQQKYHAYVLQALILLQPPRFNRVLLDSIGIALAISSGFLIGSSFIFKKKGLLASQGDHLGEGVAYLKNKIWWTGMIMMILGELCNFCAYAFVATLVVTPMGALSVVICAILSSIFLKERLTLIGWIGCAQCVFGSVVIALNAPTEQSVNTAEEFKHLFLAPAFLVYAGVVVTIASAIIFYFAPLYGKKSMLWYICVCSLIGGLSVSCTQGLGACILTSVTGVNQFNNWFIYILAALVISTIITELYFLNIALALFNTAMGDAKKSLPCTLKFSMCGTTSQVTSIILYKGVQATPKEMVSVVFGFLVVCFGVVLLQLSKVDPTHLQNLDNRTSILLQAARESVKVDDITGDPEKGVIAEIVRIACYYTLVFNVLT